MSYTAYGVTADGTRVPLSVTAETGSTGLVVPSVHLDGQVFDRVVVDVVPGEPRREEWHGSVLGLPVGGWRTVADGSGFGVPLDAVEVEPIRVAPDGTQRPEWQDEWTIDA